MQQMFYGKNFLKMDKTERLQDALNNPEKYSSEEIEEMLQDAEVKEIFELLDKTKSSLQTITAADIDAEWNKFKNKNLNGRKSGVLIFPTFFSRKIAASVTIVIISITAVAAIVGISVGSLGHKENAPSDDEVIKTINNIVVNQEDSLKIPLANSSQSFGTIIFDNEPLEVIMRQIGDFYGYGIEFRNVSSKSLRLYFRWNQAATIHEIVESLNNFEQIHLTIEGETIKID